MQHDIFRNTDNVTKKRRPDVISSLNSKTYSWNLLNNVSNNENDNPNCAGLPISEDVPMLPQVHSQMYSQIEAVFIPNGRDWHNSIDPLTRNFIVCNLVNVKYQLLDLDEMPKLINCAKNVEVELYATANSIHEYYLLMVQKILTFEKELKDMLLSQDKILSSMNILSSQDKETNVYPSWGGLSDRRLRYLSVQTLQNSEHKWAELREKVFFASARSDFEYSQFITNEVYKIKEWKKIMSNMNMLISNSFSKYDLVKYGFSIF